MKPCVLCRAFFDLQPMPNVAEQLKFFNDEQYKQTSGESDRYRNAFVLHCTCVHKQFIFISHFELLVETPSQLYLEGVI